MPREGGASSNRGGRHSIVCVGGYWIIRLREGLAEVLDTGFAVGF
jgi:hypothetical protein